MAATASGNRHAEEMQHRAASPSLGAGAFAAGWHGGLPAFRARAAALAALQTGHVQS
jgi:hypothetical protein